MPFEKKKKEPQVSLRGKRVKVKEVKKKRTLN